MNADGFRQFYGYHFAANRTIWNFYITALSDEQFTQDIGYSHGSIRNQITHLMSVDDAWFCELRGMAVSESLDPADLADRDALRAHWDNVEQTMRAYLAELRDDMLLTKPIVEEEDKNLMVWQVLIHVVNHGTDHRAQILRSLNDLGLDTPWPQDYIFYVYDHLSEQ
jgi:uncharacterized damage-inducible protein DinB